MDTFLLLLLLLFVFFLITCFIYQFLLRKSPWKYCTSWFSSFAKYYSCAVIVAVVVTFVVLLKVVPLVLILTAIPRILRELMQVCFFCFFFLHFKGVLTPTLRIIILSGKSFPKRNSDSERTFQGMKHSRYGIDCPNNRLCCLYEFVQGYYSQDLAQ